MAVVWRCVLELLFRLDEIGRVVVVKKLKAERPRGGRKKGCRLDRFASGQRFKSEQHKPKFHSE